MSLSQFSAGFEKPSAIQQRAILPIIKGRDVIAQAQSGTGKTAMTSLVTLQQINTKSREVSTNSSTNTEDSMTFAVSQIVQIVDS